MKPERHAHVAIGALAPGTIAEALEAFCQAEQVPADVTWRLKVAVNDVAANIVMRGMPESVRQVFVGCAAGR